MNHEEEKIMKNATRKITYAAMIAAQGYYEYEAGHLADASLNASAADSVN